MLPYPLTFVMVCLWGDRGREALRGFFEEILRTLFLRSCVTKEGDLWLQVTENSCLWQGWDRYPPSTICLPNLCHQGLSPVPPSSFPHLIQRFHKSTNQNIRPSRPLIFGYPTPAVGASNTSVLSPPPSFPPSFLPKGKGNNSTGSRRPPKEPLVLSK